MCANFPMSPGQAPQVWVRMAGLVAISLAWAMAAVAEVPTPDSDPATALRNRYAALSEQLEQSPIRPGLYLQSVESSHTLQGDVYAAVDYPFATIRDAFTTPANWCEALILHLNVKYCRATTRAEGTVLSVAIGRKIDQPLRETHRVEFSYDVASLEADYMKVDLDARRGPFGTRNYDLALELVALEGDRALLHVKYSYTYGFMARLAMGIYLATSGQEKVGFTMSRPEDDRAPHFIGGLRGALERNIMRYYLAIDAYLGALATPAPERFEESLERWFTATELYAIQLHEVDHDAYIAMKRREYQRQQNSGGHGPPHSEQSRENTATTVLALGPIRVGPL